MWHSKSKYQKIGALVKVSRKQLKAVLALGVKKLGPVSVASKLGKFPLFDNFFDFSPLDFPDLDNFCTLAEFWPFNFFDFLACSIQSPPNSPILPLPSFFSEAGLLPLFLLGVGSLNDLVVFNIAVNRVAILLKP